MRVRVVDFLDNDLRLGLRESALQQQFHLTDPNGRDDAVRPGFRLSSSCYQWAGFDGFWNVAGPRITDLAHEVDADCGDQVREIQLKRTNNGGYFERHQDGAYPGEPVPTVSFLYYLGDRASFTGGDLCFDDEVVSPDDNSLVVFPALDFHGVTEVVGAGAVRLTINGYFVCG